MYVKLTIDPNGVLNPIKTAGTICLHIGGFAIVQQRDHRNASIVYEGLIWDVIETPEEILDAMELGQ